MTIPSTSAARAPKTPPFFGPFIPKLVVCLREGYSPSRFGHDLVAGVTVAIIALPLAMALGIASIPANVAEELRAINPLLTPPALGLFTAVVAGFLISLLGGSRVLIGGPTGAFIVIVFGIAGKHGYTGLATATAMAGIIMILMGVLRLGSLIKFIPYPVTTGFTSGIAVIIASSQLKDFFGLRLVGADGVSVPVPADFIPKIQVLSHFAHTVNWSAVGVAAGALAVMLVIRRIIPRLPGAIVAVVLSALAVKIFNLPVETIGSKFGDLPRTLPAPHLPFGDAAHFDWTLLRELLPEAFTIALLAGIESLLAAVVADGMTGYRHKSDCELVAQGVANIAAAFFWGLPATGAIARTVANIKSGGRTPISGIVHSVTLLVFMLLLAPLAKLVPLAALSAILMLVAWNMAEIDHFRSILKTPRGDVLVLLVTFALTVFADLTVAVGSGMVLASLVFMKRMSDLSHVKPVHPENGSGESGDPAEEIADAKDPTTIRQAVIPPGVEVYEIDGPFFFGIADRLKDTLAGFERPPAVFILRMRKVPHIDATGLHALDEFHQKCRRDGTTLLLSGVHAQPLFAMVESGLDRKVGPANMLETFDDALIRARSLLQPA